MLKKIIDEVVNYETFSKSLISSIGYGLGFIIPTYLKFNTFVLILIGKTILIKFFLALFVL